ncbi:hypothetical protein HDU86_004674 [Geranomyces michiganensis]|nr:hypothetical protein HDU86_004674 [Geranomyces michiganensis]
MTITISSSLPDLITPDRAWPGDSSSAAATSIPTVRHHQPNVALVFAPPLSTGLVPGKGDLYITDCQLYFFDAATPVCVAIDYPSIGIHAISRGGDGVVGAHPHIYAQLDEAAIKVMGSNTAGDADDAGADDETPELRFVPDDSSALDAMYQAMSSCAALHPDPDADPNGTSDEEGSDNGWVYAADDPRELNELQQAALAHLDSVFEGPNPLGNLGRTTEKSSDHQFADAEDDAQR